MEEEEDSDAAAAAAHDGDDDDDDDMMMMMIMIYWSKNVQIQSTMLNINEKIKVTPGVSPVQIV